MRKPDRRTERTRAALMSAFIETLLTEGYDAITIEGIAQRANVGRSTFYMHYKTKEHILREAMGRPSSILAALVGGDLPLEPVLHWMEHFQEQRRRNHVFFEGAVRTLWAKRLAEMIEPRLATVARSTRAHPLLPQSVIARQIAEMQLALIGSWLNAKQASKADAIAEALVDSTRATLAALLRLRPGTSTLIPGEKLQFRRV